MLSRGFTAVVVGVTLLLAACNGDDTGTGTVDSGSTTTASPGSSTSMSTPATTATTSSLPPFDADTEPEVSTESQGFPLMVSVSEQPATGYRRFIFGFVDGDAPAGQAGAGDVRPGWDVRYVPPDEVVQDGSGNPVPVGGTEHLRIAFKANMHDRDGMSTLRDSVPPGSDLVFASDFEGRVTWFYGADAKRPFRVEYLGDGRVAVDVA